MSHMYDKYAKYYDILYSDKNYEEECNFIESVFNKFSIEKPKEILDIGCGTGGHMIILLNRGYKVTGIDASKNMAELAEKKIMTLGLHGNILAEKMSDFKLDRSFDAAICMFAVMNYVTDTDEFLKSLLNIRKHLRNGAIFLFDFWYGPSVLHIMPSTRIKIVEKPNIKVIRTATPEIDTFNDIVISHYYLMAMNGDRVVDELKETHVLRYYFPQELIHFLKTSGFEPLTFCEFPNIERKPSEETWNVAVVSRAV